MPLEPLVRKEAERCDLYFLVYPDVETRARAAALARRVHGRNHLKGPLMAEARLHVSLAGLGSWPARPDPLITIAKAAAGRVLLKPFDVALDRIEHWSGPLVALGDDGTIGLQGLQEEIHWGLVEEGLVSGRAPRFVPHLTLLRDHHKVPGEFITPLTWTVKEFVLVGSYYGQGRHEIFGRWPLLG